MEAIVRYIDENRQRYIDELIEILRIPSISSSAEHTGEVLRCAEYLRDKMLEAGLTHAEVVLTPGHPIVYGEWLEAPGRPTVLIYGHYDVQPVDPLNEWITPPFEPSIRENNLYARGSVDDKGQVYIHLKAIEAHLKTAGRLPVNVKFIIEGEEEVGSEHLGNFLAMRQDLIKGDLVVISDTPMLAHDVPSICYGLRGLAYMEVEVIGSKQDLHSGSFGGVAANPAMVLATIISQLKFGSGYIAIPGFYDRVRLIEESERAVLASLPFNEQEFLELSGLRAVSGELGYTTLERVWARPSLDVNGLVSGFIEEGSKTIIPAKASAKISMRLVPDQDPDEIARLFDRFVRELAPPSVEVNVRYLHGGKPFLAPYDHPAFQVGLHALEKGFGKRAVFIREGGSIPFVSTIYETLQRPCILLGFGLPDENSHAPNERMDLNNFHQGIISSAYMLDGLAGIDMTR